MTIIDVGHSISEVAASTGLTAHTLRYYEREGLMLHPVDRASSTHRSYTDADLGWVQFLTKLRKTGLPIAGMRRYAELVRRGDESYSERLELLRAHREAVVAQMAEMSSSLAAIDYKIDLYTKEIQQ